MISQSCQAGNSSSSRVINSALLEWFCSMIWSVGAMDLSFLKQVRAQDTAVPWQRSPACSLSTGHRCRSGCCVPPSPCGGGPGARLAAGLRLSPPTSESHCGKHGAAVPLAGLWGRVPSCKEHWELLESPGHTGSFATDAVVVSVARSPSNSEWLLQILEPPARGGRTELS